MGTDFTCGTAWCATGASHVFIDDQGKQWVHPRECSNATAEVHTPAELERHALDLEQERT